MNDLLNRCNTTYNHTFLQVMASTRDGATGRTVMAAVISLIATEIETAAANGATPADIAANLHRIAAPELRKLEGMR